MSFIIPFYQETKTVATFKWLWNRWDKNQFAVGHTQHNMGLLVI